MPNACFVDVARRDFEVWSDIAKDDVAITARRDRNRAAGQLMRQRLDEQVKLITSLPDRGGATRSRIDAGWACLTPPGPAKSRRKFSPAAMLRRAAPNTIARTEVARTASALVQARSEHVGSIGYIWRTARDSDVRSEHRALEGQFIRWDKPPVAGVERCPCPMQGQIYNCRCFPEPVIPEQG